MNNDPKLEKNYLLALILIMGVLIFYPYFLKQVYPPKQQEAADVSGGAPVAEPVALKEKELEPAVKPQAVLSAPEGPFIEPSTPPSLIRYENNLYDVDFSTLGGSLVRLFYKGDRKRPELTQMTFYEGELTEPGLFGVGLLHEKADLTRSIFKLVRRDDATGLFEFVYEKPGEYRLTKTYILGKDDPIIAMDITLGNLSGWEKHFPVELTYGMFVGSGEKSATPSRGYETEALVLTDKVEKANLDKVAKKGFQVAKEIHWAGVVKRHFALLVKPDWKTIVSESSANSDKTVLWGKIRMEPVSLAAGEKETKHFFIYAGPQRYEILKSFDVGFEKILSRGFFGMFKIWLLIALKFCHRFTHNFGWDIIIITLLIKGLFAPLTHMSYQSMEKMKAIAPKQKTLQEKYKKNPEKLNKEMMELYKRHKVNPMAGCLPMLLQIPIFIAFYQVLFEAIELKGAPFIFWITDLSQPDRLFTFPFSLPLIGNGFNLLPILMTVSMFYQQKLTPQTAGSPEQQKMMAFLPLIFAFIFYGMPSGLVLYWFINNILSIIQQVFIKRIPVILHHDDHHE